MCEAVQRDLKPVIYQVYGSSEQIRGHDVQTHVVSEVLDLESQACR